MATELPGFHFQYPLRVRYSEVDAQGIVFNSRYLEYCDIAVTEYFRAAGMTPDSMLTVYHTNTVVVRAELDFLAPARLDDLLSVHVRTARLGRSSLEVEMAIYGPGAAEPVCRARITYVNLDEATGRAAPLPQNFRDAITSLDPETRPA